MDAKVEHGEVGDDDVLALGLQVHLEREGEDVGEHHGDVPEGDDAGDGGDARVLPEQDEERLGEHVDGEEEDGGGEEDDPGALKVDAQHVILLPAVRLPAQRPQRARHSQEYAGAEAHEDGGDERVGSELGGADVADEGLANDGQAEGREVGEDGRPGHNPQLPVLF